jgi:hypothetical protein
VLLLASALWLARQRAPQSLGANATPEACLDRLFQAAQDGAVSVYLDCFAGPERQRLERELAGQPQAAFARTLVEASQQLKGRAVFPVRSSSDSSPASPSGDPSRSAALSRDETRALFAVERIYANRLEKQLYHLIRESGVWRIHTVQAAEAYQPSQPYGTPVYETSPPADR